jgi:peptidoglycan hydrolase-like protein with peptidoglycan-binding domain
MVSQIQQQLIRLGLYPGPADGIETPMTGDAIRSYQQMNGLDADGRATQALLVHMKTSSLGNAMEGDATEQGSRDE